jgi:2-aminoadipate transaminase
VTYTSSFSKTVAPGLRTGYFVSPVAEAAAFEERANSTYISPPFFTQATISEFIDQGRFEPNLERVKAGLRARRDAMLEALEAAFPDGSTWSRPEGGYFVWLDLGEGGDVAELARRADAEEVAFVPGTDFFPRASELGAGSARLAFSYEPPERITEGIDRLGSLLAATV